MKVSLERSDLKNNGEVQNIHNLDGEMKLVGCSICSSILFAALDHSHLSQYLAAAVARLLLQYRLLGKCD